MAFYKNYDDKRPSHKDDWRDDEMTRRPGQAGRGQRGGRMSTPKAPETTEGTRAANGQQERPPYRREARPVQGPRDTQTQQERPAYNREARPVQGRQGTYAKQERPPYNRAVRPAGEGARMPMRETASEAPRRDFREEAQGMETRENLLVGRNPIREALKAERDIERLLVARGEMIGSAREIIAMAREQRVVVQHVDRERLDAMAPKHQGMIAVVSAFSYSTVEAILETAKEREEQPFVIVLDGITDPHNLGAIIRTAECAGAHGVIVPERRAVGLTPAAVKASAGAVEYLKVAKVNNITRLIDDFKKQGIWTYAAAMEGTSYEKTDLSGAVALVIGAEGDGVSRLVKEHCDGVISLPIKGKIDSLNASVAAGVLMYAVASTRAK